MLPFVEKLRKLFNYYKFPSFIRTMDIKEKIFNTTFDLFLKYGVKSVSMDDICRKLGISKKTIYTVIENKKDLIEKIIQLHIQKDEDDIRQLTKSSDSAVDEMCKIGRHVIKFLRAMKPSLIYDLQKYYPQAWNMIEDQHYGFIYQTIKANLERGQREGLYLNSFDAKIIAKLYVEKTHCIADEEHFPSSEFTRPQLFEQLFMYHMRGISSEKGLKSLESIEI